MEKKNGHDLEVTRPLKHRPDVIVVETVDGRKKVIGDGRPFSGAELVAIQGLAPSTHERLQFTEQEQAELDAAEDRLRRASHLVEELWDESAACGKQLEDLYREIGEVWGTPLNGQNAGAANAKKADRLRHAAREIQHRMNAAREIQNDALRERNETERRIQAIAIARQRPIQFHKPSVSTEDKLAALEKRQ